MTVTSTTASASDGDDVRPRPPRRDGRQPLLTSASLALSLAPPRAPPHGTALRGLYAGRPGPSTRGRRRLARDGGGRDGVAGRGKGRGKGGVDDAGGSYQSHSISSRVLQLAALHPHLTKADLRHPHLPSSLSIPDALTRFLGATLSLERQHRWRDTGKFGRVADGMVTVGCPTVALGHWREAWEFMELTGAPSPGAVGGDYRKSSNGKKSLGKNGWTRERLVYGDHPSQHLDLFIPSRKWQADVATTPKDDDEDRKHGRIPVRGTVFFVHGGAWGSGKPWMYRLVAPSFLRLGFAVVVAGYRVYPLAPSIHDQCRDVRRAWDACEGTLDELVQPVDGGGGDGGDGWVGNLVMGHSSGAHVALLVLVDMIGERAKGDSSPSSSDTNHAPINSYPWNPDFFVGLSGPYDISHHFDYEAGRGVEQISPMMPICGHSRENFDKASPARRLRHLVAKYGELLIRQRSPPLLLVHGIEDATVPFTATADAGRALRGCGMDCDELYLEETGHQDVVMHFMLGGRARDLALDWMVTRRARGEGLAASRTLSRL
ncbi:hypothetical protein ACHAWF_010244 [Thalassiosira exigua]